MKHNAERSRPESDPFSGEILPRYTDMDLWQRLNNVALVSLHIESVHRLLLDVAGGAAWRGGPAAIGPETTSTDFIAEAHYPTPLTAAAHISHVNERDIGIASALSQKGHCVGLHQSRVVRWTPDAASPCRCLPNCAPCSPDAWPLSPRCRPALNPKPATSQHSRTRTHALRPATRQAAPRPTACRSCSVARRTFPPTTCRPAGLATMTSPDAPATSPGPHGRTGPGEPADCADGPGSPGLARGFHDGPCVTALAAARSGTRRL
jgi:acyl-CoA thioester hydrolase